MVLSGEGGGGCYVFCFTLFCINCNDLNCVRVRSFPIAILQFSEYRTLFVRMCATTKLRLFWTDDETLLQFVHVRTTYATHILYYQRAAIKNRGMLLYYVFLAYCRIRVFKIFRCTGTYIHM